MGRLLAGGGVHRGAQAVEDLGDLDRRVPLGALEQQVLEEVRDAGLLGRLVRGARPHPEPQGDGAHRGHRLGYDPDARVELGDSGARRSEDRRRLSSLARGSRLRPPPPSRRARPAPPSRRPPPGGPGSPVPTDAKLLGRLALDVGVVGEPQADPAALLVDLDHRDVDLVALVEDVLDRARPARRA